MDNGELIFPLAANELSGEWGNHVWLLSGQNKTGIEGTGSTQNHVLSWVLPVDCDIVKVIASAEVVTDDDGDEVAGGDVGAVLVKKWVIDSVGGDAEGDSVADSAAGVDTDQWQIYEMGPLTDLSHVSAGTYVQLQMAPAVGVTARNISAILVIRPTLGY